MKKIALIAVLALISACATVPTNNEGTSDETKPATGLWVAVGLVLGAVVVSSLDDGGSDEKCQKHVVVTGSGSTVVGC